MHFTTSQKKIVTHGLSHIALLVADIEQSVRFYTDMFNIEVINREEHMAFLHTPGTNDSIALIRTGEPVVQGGLHHIGFFTDSDNFNKALKYITDNSIKVLGGPGKWESGARYVYIEDPNGYRVQISTGGK